MRAKMWAPGVSGNPKGRTKRKTLEESIGHLLQSPMTIDGEKVLGIEALARVIVSEAMVRRNTTILREVFDRYFPKKLSLDLNAKGQVTVVFDDQDRREMEQIVGEDLEPGDEEDEP